jgi:hypothetical protein
MAIESGVPGEAIGGEEPTHGLRGGASVGRGGLHGQDDDASAGRGGLLSRLAGGGTAGNVRLTAATGVVLLVLLAVIGLTLLRLHGLLSVHLFVGMLLIPPVLLKMASTGYRFARYYTHNARYRRKGPPEAIVRALAPLVVISTVVVFASGVALLLIGPSSRDELLPIHKVSFIVWVSVTALHVLGHMLELPGALGVRRESLGHVDGGGASWHRSPMKAGGAGRTLSLSAALVSGIALAVLLVPQYGPWLNAQHHLLGGR